MRRTALLALLPAVIACAGSSPTETIGGLVGSLWRAETVDGRAVLDGVETQLAFESAEQVVGTGGCNRFFGTVRVVDGAVHMGPFGATRRACEPAIMDQETRLLHALEATRALRLEPPSTLVLVDGEERPVATLARVPAS